MLLMHEIILIIVIKITKFRRNSDMVLNSLKNEKDKTNFLAVALKVRRDTFNIRQRWHSAQTLPENMKLH